MSFKKTVFSYFAFFLFLIVVVPSVFYVSDPYMLFHKHWFHKGKMYNNLRIQNYGLIKYEAFDAVILGTSMLENTSAVEATKKLKNTYANLSLSGGSFYEKFVILNFALKTKKIKSVILSLDYHFGVEKNVGNSFYPDLYSENSLGSKLKIYSTNKAVLCTFLNISCDFTERNLDRPTAWLNLEEHARRFGGFDNWLKYQEDSQIKDAFRQLLENKENYKNEFKKYKTIIDNEIIPLFENKETSFSIIIPPYSVFWWNIRKNELEEMMKPYKYLVERTKDYPNVKIYWFFDDDYVFDISKYKDLVHYHDFVNSLQLDAIQNGTHILNTTNYKQKIETFIKKVRAFDSEPYLERIRKKDDK